MPRGAALGKSRQEKARQALALKNNSLYKPFPEPPALMAARFSMLIYFTMFAAQYTD
jgi:hypothetical protein